MATAGFRSSRTFSKQCSCHMVQLRISIRVVPDLARPGHHLPHKRLLRRFSRRKGPQKGQQSSCRSSNHQRETLPAYRPLFFIPIPIQKPVQVSQNVPRTFPLTPHGHLSLAIDVQQIPSQIPTAAALPGTQQRSRTLEQHVDGRGPVFSFDVPRGDHAELLVGFVIGAGCNSMEKRGPRSVSCS